MREDCRKKLHLFYSTNSLIDKTNVESAYKCMEDIDSMKNNLQIGDCITVKYCSPEKKNKNDVVTETIKVLKKFSNYVLFEKENGTKITFLWHELWKIWKRKGVIEEW